MAALFQDKPKLHEELALALQAADGRVASLTAQLAEAEAQRDALRTLVGRPGPVLSGDSLRAVAHQLMREEDPDQSGMHYQDVTKRLLEHGHRISGKSEDKAPNVRSHIGHGPKAAALFEPVGKGLGTYTWR